MEIVAARSTSSSSNEYHQLLDMSEGTDELDDLVAEFVTESREHLSTVENDLLLMEDGAGDEDTVNNVFRCVHSVKGVAGFLGLEIIQALAHSLESTLDLVRQGQLSPTPKLVSILLEAIDGLKELINNVSQSNAFDIDHHVQALRAFIESVDEETGEGDGDEGSAPSAGAEAQAVEAPKAGESAGEEVPAAKADPVPDQATKIQTTEARTVKSQAANVKGAKGVKNPKPGVGKAKKNSAKPVSDTHAADSIRVNVQLLNRLMNLSGEMVLGRNQVLQSIRPSGDRGLQQAVTNLSQVVSEMQEAIMQTRLQSVGTVFQRFPRIVRDLASKLSKECRLDIEGKEVELDRSILEALGDPLTHLVRNALDHGIEAPEERRALGKPKEGLLTLQAFHQGGNVKIKIEDDGAGMDADRLRLKAVEKGVLSMEQASALSDRDARMLIFAPGFSTAEQLSDVSGRGVGMDVVRSNIEKLGGTVEVQSEVGRGSTLTVTIPLTLAIMPALVVSCAERRYVLPQSNVTELVRIRASDSEERIVTVKNRKVLRLRGKLLPVIHLREALGVEHEDTDYAGRTNNIMVVQAGGLIYGLVIDSPPDTEEIVVKPLGSHLRNREEYSGSTILGDGQAALILDVVGLAAATSLRAQDALLEAPASAEQTQQSESGLADFVVFRNAPHEQFAVPLGLVNRIQRVDLAETCTIGSSMVHQTDDRVMPIVRLENYLDTGSLPEPEGQASLLVLKIHECEFAVMTSAIDEIHRAAVQVDDRTLSQPGIIGSFQRGRDTVRLLDCATLAKTALPQLIVDPEPDAFVPDAAASEQPEKSGPARVMLAEDSKFFRDHVARVMRQAGFEVVTAVDGDDAWNQIQENFDSLDLVVTDIEMPNCDGLELTRRIRAKPEFAAIPVIALSSLSTDESIERGRSAGVSDYLVKLDDGSLVAAIQGALKGNS